MAANQFTAVPTFPLFLLFFKEFVDSMVSDELQVFYHAHSVTRPVSAVDSFQPIAGKTAAFKTEKCFVVCQFGTSLFQKGTFFVSRSATRAVRHSDAFVFDVVFVG